MTKKKIPYNCPLIAEWFEDFSNIRDCFTRLGGLPYEILKHSGLDKLELFGFFDDNNWEDANELRKMQSDNRIIALEIYMDSGNGGKTQKAYLFSDSINGYYSVFRDGVTQQGKLFLTKEKLAKWARKGYSCIISSEEEPEENFRQAYEEMFENRLYVRNILPLSREIQISSNGYKQVYLLLDYGADEPSDYVLEVDYYAINTCFRLLTRERYIRQNIDPFFLINRIHKYDTEVGRFLKTEKENIFLREMDLELEQFPNCYQLLAYYTAYIAYYYPDLQERMNQPLPEAECVAIGASMEQGLFAAYCMSDGTVYPMKNPKLYTGVTAMSYDCGIEDEYRFDLKYDLLDVGIGISELGLSFRKMLKTGIYQEVTRMGISLPTSVLPKEQIQRYMKKNETGISAMLYHELELEEADGKDIIKGAAELAGMEEVLTYNRALAIHAGYEAMNSKDALGRYEHGIVFDWRNDYLEVTLLQGEKDGVRILAQDAEENPLERGEDIIEEMTVYDILFRNMRAKMLEQEEFLKLMKLDESDTKAWQAFYDSRDTVMKQFMRENDGVLILKNVRGYMEEELPYARFKELFRPYFEEAKEVIEGVLSSVCFEKEDINKVYVSGYWGNYAYVWDCLEDFFGKGKLCVMEDTSKAAVFGAAYLAGKQKVT